MSKMSETEDSIDAWEARNSEDRHTPRASSSRGSDGTSWNRSRLSTTFLGIGASIAVFLRAAYGFTIFLPEWKNGTHPEIAMAAWVILFFVILVSVISINVLGLRMPNGLFFCCLALLVLVLALDLWSIWERHNIGEYASAGLTATMALLLFLTMRRSAEILIAAGFLGLILIIAIGVNTPLRPETLPAQIGVLGLALVPVVIGVYLTGGFSAMIAGELERILAQSTLKSPRLSSGFLAAEELARMDLAAEEILDAVATGSMPLPLAPETATRAADIAMKLRSQLLAGRRETWLHHAVTESVPLGRAVHLTDGRSCAGLLDARQRQGLLEALWLFVNDTDTAVALPTLEIVIGSELVASPSGSDNMLVIPISLVVEGISRRNVDSSIWDSINKIGKFRDSVVNDRLKIDIECRVDNPV
jgi:hypothetical protein